MLPSGSRPSSRGSASEISSGGSDHAAARRKRPSVSSWDGDLGGRLKDGSGMLMILGLLVCSPWRNHSLLTFKMEELNEC